MKIRWYLDVLLFGVILMLSHGLLAGTLGNWSTTNSLNIARFGNVAILDSNTAIYTFGGYAYTTTPYPVESSNINQDGSLNNWSLQSSTMLSARGSGVGAIVNGYLYAISGDAGPGLGLTTTVEGAAINMNGTLSSWSTIGILPRGFWESGLIQTTSYLYIIGGWLGGVGD